MQLLKANEKKELVSTFDNAIKQTNQECLEISFRGEMIGGEIGRW